MKCVDAIADVKKMSQIKTGYKSVHGNRDGIK